jgi:uncharacterized protein YcaQ
VLPILCCGELIGRLDAKAHRAQGVFEVRALFSQPAMTWTEVQVAAVAGAIANTAAWHGTPQVQIARAQPATLLKRLRSALAVHAANTNCL